MPNVRKTPQHTVAVDDQLWQNARVVAAARGETVADVIRKRLESYVKRHADLLDDHDGTSSDS